MRSSCLALWLLACTPSTTVDFGPQSAEPAAAPASASAPATPRPLAELHECIRDPVVDAARRWDDPLERGPARATDFTTQTVADLDGDGVEERAVTSETKGCAGMGGNCLYLLYLSQRGCGAYAGKLYAALHSIEVMSEESDGRHDFRILSQDGCAGRAGALLRLRWSGGSYQQVESMPCSCPDDAPQGPRPSACPP